MLPVPPESAVHETATGSDKMAGHKQEDLPLDATRLNGEAEGLKHRSLCPAMTRSRLPAQTEGKARSREAQLKLNCCCSTCGGQPRFQLS